MNSGIINANQSAGIIIQTSETFTNTGTLQVAAADTMHVPGGTFSSFSATTLSSGTYTVPGTLVLEHAVIPLGECAAEGLIVRELQGSKWAFVLINTTVVPTTRA